MNKIFSKKIRLISVVLAAFTMSNMANADSIIDVGAGYDASTSVNNSYFTITNYSNSDLTNLVFSATDSVITDGFTNSTWSVADVLANGSAQYYFAGTQAFQSNFNATYADNITPGDITYDLTGLINGQAFDLSFSTDNNATGYYVAFLGLSRFGSNLGVSDYATVASLDATAVPVPEQTITFALGLLMLSKFMHRKSKVSADQAALIG